MKKLQYLLITLILAIVALHSSCNEQIINADLPDLPANPYDSISYNNDGSIIVQVDTQGFFGLYNYVLKTKCGQPACHDGAFEPDFRTPLSSYSTSVYHPVLKQYNQGQFDYRVLPYDTAGSWLHERITTNDPVLGRMPLYDTLAPWQIELINTWILNGAKDIFGNDPSVPNAEPAPFGMVAYLDDVNGMRLDTIRSQISEPMPFPQNSVVDIWYGLYDDLTLPFDFRSADVKFSLEPFNFDQALSKKLIIEKTPHMAPSYIGIAPYYLHVKINTAEFEKNRTYYMRLYVQDADHNEISEIPENGVPLYLYLFFSFKIV